VLLATSTPALSNRTGQAAPGSPSGQSAQVIPASIAADCSRDVTAEINAWIVSVPNGTTLVFGQNACYRTERFIAVTERTGLVFEGNGARFRRFELSPPELRYPKANPHFWFQGGGRITIRNLRVEGTNTVSDGWPGFGTYDVAFEFEHAFTIRGVLGVTITDVAVDAVWGDGIYLGSYLRAQTTNVRISRVTIDRNGRQGIAITHANGVLIEDARILHSRRAGIDLEPNPSGSVSNVEIRKTYINSRLLAFASGGSGQVSGIYLHLNTINRTGVPWVFVRASDGTRRRDWRVHDNIAQTTLGSPMAALLFVNVDNVEVRRNVSHLAWRRYMKGVEFRGAGGQLYVVGNDFTGACVPYVADAQTAPVVASGNIYNTSCVMPSPR
jgi:hypothetical protein